MCIYNYSNCAKYSEWFTAPGGIFCLYPLVYNSSTSTEMVFDLSMLPEII